jgi:hypothetical protein
MNGNITIRPIRVILSTFALLALAIEFGAGAFILGLILAIDIELK